MIQAAPRAGQLDLEPLLVGVPAHLPPLGLACLAAVAGQD